MKYDDPIEAGTPESLDSALKYHLGCLSRLPGRNLKVVTLTEQAGGREKGEYESHYYAG
jgi:hypothetical protein